jgi:hypothetical protein
VLVGEERPHVRCEVAGGAVTVTWTVPENVLALGFLVSRDGQVVATLGPEARSFREEAPPGAHTYVLSTNNWLGGPGQDPAGVPDFLIGECQVVVEGEPGLPGPEALRCAVLESFPVQVQLTWRDPVAYDSIVVVRDNRAIATIEGSATQFHEMDPGAGLHLYEVYGVAGNRRSPAATCVVETPGPPAQDRLFMVPAAASSESPDGAANGDPATDPATDPAGNAGPPPSDTVTVLLENIQPVQGWSFGVRSDPRALQVAEATTEGTDAGELNGGSGPTFLAINVLEEGVTMGAIVQQENPANVLPPGDGHSLLRVRYAPGPDGDRGSRYVVSFSSELGDPPVAVVIIVDGFEVWPATSPGVVSFAAERFLRGDGNNDGQVGLSDGVYVLEWLFRGGPEPPCLEAADVNGSLQGNIGDAIYLFQTLFIGGPTPPAPYPECGTAPLFLGCEASFCDP